MTSSALRPAPRRAGRRPLGRHRPSGIDVKAELLSVAGAVGSPVYDGSGERVGTLDDLVVRWDPAEPHPPLAGAIVRVRRRRSFVPRDAIADLQRDMMWLQGPLEQCRPERQPWFVALAHDVLDRQIVDVDGADVVRVSDLVLGRLPDGLRLVGTDVSTRTLLRRLGPAWLRQKVVQERVYDWASVAAFSAPAGEADSVLHLTDVAARLRERGPADVEALLDDLPAHERAQLAEHATGP